MLLLVVVLYLWNRKLNALHSKPKVSRKVKETRLPLWAFLKNLPDLVLQEQLSWNLNF